MNSQTTIGHPLLLERYPQVIVHETSKGLFYQVVYLCAECPVNSNISELLDSFGRALDSALGNMDPFYEKRIAKLSSIGDKTALLCNYIRTFSIGMLVIDEIQHMDFKANNTRSFDIFLKIINSTKVGIFVLGQGDAYKKIAKNLQVKRRLGTQYYGVEYCFDYDYFKLLISELSMYSWRDDGKKLIDIYPGNETAETISAGTELDTSDARIFSTDKHRYGRPLSENEIKALYFVSTGSISVLITCWIAIQRYGIEFGEWPELTYDFLHVLLERQNHGLEEQNRVEIKKDPMIAELGVITEGRKMLEKLFEEEKKSSALKAISEACVASSANDENNAMPSISESVFQDVSTHNAQRNNPWTIDQIQDVVVKITKKNNDASKEELVMACIQKLEKTRKPRRTIKKQLLTAADPTGNERFINLAQQTLDEANSQMIQMN